VDTGASAADRGTLIHGAIATYTRSSPQRCGKRGAELTALGTTIFAPLKTIPKRAPSGGRASSGSRWFAEWSSDASDARRAACRDPRRDQDSRRARTFRLLPSADRIERAPTAVMPCSDYKTARPAPKSRCAADLRRSSPEARSCAARIFRIAAGASVAELTYVVLKAASRGNPANPIQGRHARQPGGPRIGGSPHRAQIRGATQPYLSLVHPMWKRITANTITWRASRNVGDRRRARSGRFE